MNAQNKSWEVVNRNGSAVRNGKNEYTMSEGEAMKLAEHMHKVNGTYYKAQPSNR